MRAIPLNVMVAGGTSAHRAIRRRAAKAAAGTGPIIVPGIEPTPEHDLHNRGGKTIVDLHYVNVFVGDRWDDGDIERINGALRAAMSDSSLNEIMAQYLGGSSVSAAFEGATTIPGPGPTVVSQGDIEALVARSFQKGRFDGADLSNTIFNFMLPPGTLLNTDAGTKGSLNAPQKTMARN
jgi:hypothetical protein